MLAPEYSKRFRDNYKPSKHCTVVVVYHVAIGHGLLVEILAFSNRLRSTHCNQLLEKMCRPVHCYLGGKRSGGQPGST